MLKTFETMDGQPVQTVKGSLVVLPAGEADVHRVSQGYAIKVAGSDMVVVPPREFERLIAEGQMHGVVAAN